MFKEIIFKVVVSIYNIPFSIAVSIILFILLITLVFIRIIDKSNNKDTVFEHPKNTITKYIKVLFLVFFICMTFIFIIIQTKIVLHESIERDKVVLLLNDILNKRDCQVSIKGEIVSSPYMIVQELLKVTHFSHHNSRVTNKESRVVIKNKKSKLEMFLRKDSEVENEYWVYYYNQGNEDNKYTYIGRIYSDKF